MIEHAPPEVSKDCGPRCTSIFLGFLVLGAMSSWASSVLGQPEFLFLGMVGISAALVITTSPKMLLPMAAAIFLIALYTTLSSETSVFEKIPAAILATIGVVMASLVPWVLTGMGKIRNLRFPNPMHLTIVILVAIPVASLILAASVQPLLLNYSPQRSGTSILNTSLIHGISCIVIMPITLVLFSKRPKSRTDHLRFVELVIACGVIIGIQIMWLIHHQNPVPFYDWLLPLQASIALLPLMWMASRLGILGASIGVLVLGISTVSVHMLTDSWAIMSDSRLLSHNFIDDIILMSSSLIALILGSTSDHLIQSRADSQRNLNEAQSLVDASAIAIIQTSCDGTIHYANSYADRMLNTEEPVVGTKLQKYVKYDHEQQVESMLYAARLSNNVEFELPIKTNKTSDLWRLAVAKYQSPTEGRKEYLTISIVDLSSARRREASRFRIESERLQSEAQEQMLKLTSAMLSDANNLAMAVSGTAVQARKTSDLDITMFHDVLSRIESVCIETASMFERYRRATGSELPDANICCDVNEVLHMSLQSLQKDPRLVLGNTLPMGPVFVACDPSFIRFAIEQVIRNSLEASVGKTILEISMRKNHNLDTVAIRIQDDGPGITTDDLPRVTKPFFTRKTRGRGLGLSTVSSGLQKIGGRIQFESLPGLGTCVTLEFPISTQAQPHQLLEPKSGIQPAGV